MEFDQASFAPAGASSLLPPAHGEQPTTLRSSDGLVSIVVRGADLTGLFRP